MCDYELRNPVHLRDHEDLAALQTYERRYGVVAESSLEGWQNADQAMEIGHKEVESLWGDFEPAEIAC